MDSSKVMVLDAGKVVEFASPEKLLADSKTIFYGMVLEAGLIPKEQEERPAGGAADDLMSHDDAVVPAKIPPAPPAPVDNEKDENTRL